MKETTIKCDYCKKEIKESASNTIVNGKGYIHIRLIKKLHPALAVTGSAAMFYIKLRDMTDKNLERDICPECLKHIFANM